MTAFLITDAIESTLVLAISSFYSHLMTVDVAPPGYVIPVNWQGVRGASKAEITSASVEIGAIVIEQILGELGLSSSGNYKVVTIPSGYKLRSLTLTNLKLGDKVLRSEADLVAQGLRLAVIPSDPSGTLGAPQFSVPPVPARGLLPVALTGASFENGVLKLPDVAAPKIGLSLVKKNFPEEFEAQSFSLDNVTGVAAVSSKNLQLVDSAETVIWAFPGELPPQIPIVDINLKFALEQALNSALKEAKPLNINLFLRGASPTKAGVNVSAIQGALIRLFPGVLRTILEGDSVPLALATPALSEEPPTSVVAGLNVRYQGIRILEFFSNSVPGNAGVTGQIVGSQSVLRQLPPAALSGVSLAKVALIGRAPEDCELAVQLVAMNAGSAGTPIAAPGVLKLKASPTITPIWITLPEMPPISEQVGLSVRANRGRFFWVQETDLLIKLAIHDPDPGNRTLRLNGVSIATIAQSETAIPAASLPPGVFHTIAPVLESDLFLTVDLSDLSLRYAR